VSDDQATEPAPRSPPSKTFAGREDERRSRIEPPQWVLAAGRTGWAILGVAGVIVLTGFVLGRLSLVVTPVVLALFPATLLMPLANRLRRRMPNALAASTTLVVGLAGIAIVIGLMVPLVAAELPRLADTADSGVAELTRFLDAGPFGLDLGGAAGLVDRAREQIADLPEIAGPALDAAAAALEVVIATVLLLVVLFFYLKDGDRIARSLSAVFPHRLQPHLRRAGGQAWHTLGAYFRGQLLIATVDAAVIGIGLALLRVPLALPLAVVIFFGGLFPIVGAVAAGALAVLVALAHGGLVLALLVLALIITVQQLEGNVLEPLILSHVVRLHPLAVVLAVTTGAITLGVLGAFLAVPAVAIAVHVIHLLRDPELDEAQQDADTTDNESGLPPSPQRTPRPGVDP
jgi:putative heme transporter